MTKRIDKLWGRDILVPRARRFLVTWSGNEGRLQIKPSGSGDENGDANDRSSHQSMRSIDSAIFSVSKVRYS